MLDSVKNILRNLSSIEGIATALVVDKDGILIAQGSTASDSSSNDHFEDLASLFARSIHSFGPSLKATNHSGIKQLIIERENEEKLIMFVQTDYILAVATRGTINLGLIRMEVREAVEKLNPLLQDMG